MQQKNPIKAFVVVVFLALMVFLGTTVINSIRNNQQGNVAGTTETSVSQEIEVNVVDNKSEKSVFTIPYKAETSLFDYFKELQNKNTGFTFTYTDSSYGAFINSINGYVTDVSKEFWEIMINGKSSEVGMSAYIVKPGDKIELKISQITF